MLTILLTIAPVFGLILIGFLAGRTAYLSDAATRGLPEFVFRIAMPLLLFRTIATAKLPDAPVASILIAFFAGVGAVWTVAALMTLLLRRPTADGSALGMAAAFSNSVMLGIPLSLALFGTAAAPILAIIVAFDTPVMWVLATLHLALTDRGRSHSLGQQMFDIVKRLVTNPIIFAAIAGLIAQRIAFSPPQLADTLIMMIGQAAVPGALISLGLALNTYGVAGAVGAAIGVTILKLLIMPAVTWIVAGYALQLPQQTTAIITMMAALPVGANAYLFAAAYDRAPGAVSAAITVSTVASVATLTLLLLFLQTTS
jgi:predicted permease